MSNKHINFNKNQTKSKMENSTHSFREMNLVLQLVQESWIKSKAVMSWSLRKKKRGHFFVNFIFSEGNLLRICVLSQCIIRSSPSEVFLEKGILKYASTLQENTHVKVWFEKIYKKTLHFIYQKTLLHTLLMLVFKILESLEGILKLLIMVVQI